MVRAHPCICTVVARPAPAWWAVSCCHADEHLLLREPAAIPSMCDCRVPVCACRDPFDVHLPRSVTKNLLTCAPANDEYRLPPSRARPGRNEPALLPHVLRAVAAAVGKPEADVARETCDVARAVFGIPLPRAS
eukprot:364133-Chlamydomonas_euryale.AAC.7